MGYCSNCKCRGCQERRAQVNINMTMAEMALIDLRKEVKAIKSIRNRTGLSLKDAHIAIDKYKHS